MSRFHHVCALLLCATVLGCNAGYEAGNATAATGGKADGAESLDRELTEWAELAAYFGAGDDRGGIWYMGDGSDLHEGNDYCSLAYAEGEASDDWAINSSYSATPLSVEDYLILHAQSDLNSARAAYYNLSDDAPERVELEANLERLRRFLIRAVLRPDAIEMFSESDRFGGYRCIEISTPSGNYLIASGGWS